jgi:hypothetical protein
LEIPLYRSISQQDAVRVLGLRRAVPMTPQAMAAGLTVTFYPIAEASERVRTFADHLRRALKESGVRLLEYAEAMDPGRPGKLRENITVIAAGELSTGDLPVDHVQNLRTTTIVGIVEGPCPAEGETADQDKLNSIVRTLTWSIVQVAIYVEDDRWTITTMNGAVIPCSFARALRDDVLELLIPKLAAPVVPPHASDFDFRPGALDLSDPLLQPYVEDFIRSGPLWQRTGLLLYHTSMENLEFRNGFYKRIAAAYLDHRSGMSYGFLARQTALHYRPVWREREDPEEVDLHLEGDTLHLPVPEVWVLTTRSGCDKSRIDPSRDLLLMGLVRGRTVIATPRGLEGRVDSKPSYDTLTILAHALGNALVASALGARSSGSRFASMVAQSGAALAHWHGYVPSEAVPWGYLVHGMANPPVSCSTYQAALFALTGKFAALLESLKRGMGFEGDIHVEPHHGVNVTGSSLLQLARWAMEHLAGIPLSELSFPGRRAAQQ